MPNQVQWNSCFSPHFVGYCFFFIGRKLCEIVCFESAMRSSDSFISIWMNHNLALFLLLRLFIPFLLPGASLVLSSVFFPTLIHFTSALVGKFQFKWQHFIPLLRVYFSTSNACSVYCYHHRLFIHSLVWQNTHTHKHTKQLYLVISEIKVESLDTKLSTL